MHKRNFMRLGIAGGVAGLMTPKTILAAGAQAARRSPLAGGVYMTQADFGRWNEALANHHLPTLAKQMTSGKTLLSVATDHPMNGYDHYIVKHQLLNRYFEFMQEHLYDPTNAKAPAASFDLGEYRGTVFVLTMCNVHDLWMNSIEV